MSLLGRHGDNRGESNKQKEIVPTEPQKAPEIDSDSEMMALAAKHGDNLGGQKGQAVVNIPEESDSDSEMMSLLAKYGDRNGPTDAEVQVLTPPSSRQRESSGREDSDSDAEMMSLLNKYGDDAKGGQRQKTTSTEVEMVHLDTEPESEKRQYEIE